MAEELKYPQLTQDQIEIWMASPVTQIFIQCMQWHAKESVQHLGLGHVVDSSSADLTHAMTHRELGRQDAYAKAAQPVTQLEYFNMIVIPPEEEPEEDE